MHGLGPVLLLPFLSVFSPQGFLLFLSPPCDQEALTKTVSGSLPSPSPRTVQPAKARNSKEKGGGELDADGNRGSVAEKKKHKRKPMPPFSLSLRGEEGRGRWRFVRRSRCGLRRRLFWVFIQPDSFSLLSPFFCWSFPFPPPLPSVAFPLFRP